MERLPNWKALNKQAWKLENQSLAKLREQIWINKFDTTSKGNKELNLKKKEHKNFQ